MLQPSHEAVLRQLSLYYYSVPAEVVATDLSLIYNKAHNRKAVSTILNYLCWLKLATRALHYRAPFTFVWFYWCTHDGYRALDYHDNVHKNSSPSPPEPSTNPH